MASDADMGALAQVATWTQARHDKTKGSVAAPTFTCRLESEGLWSCPLSHSEEPDFQKNFSGYARTRGKPKKARFTFHQIKYPSGFNPSSTSPQREISTPFLRDGFGYCSAVIVPIPGTLFLEEAASTLAFLRECKR